MRCRAGAVTNAGAWYSPGSAERHEECRTASGTRSVHLIQPVASADSDFNRAVTLAEFRQAAATRYKLLDKNGQGRFTLPELEARLPTRPKGKGEKRRNDELDSRIGQPLPKDD